MLTNARVQVKTAHALQALDASMAQEEALRRELTQVKASAASKDGEVRLLEDKLQALRAELAAVKDVTSKQQAYATREHIALGDQLKSAEEEISQLRRTLDDATHTHRATEVSRPALLHCVG